MDEEARWGTLPDHIVVEIMMYLQLQDRFHMSLTCKSWNHSFNLGYLWRCFVFRFFLPSHDRFLRLFPLHGKHLQCVRIYVDQGQPENRENACSVIRQLAEMEKRRLHTLRLTFFGENPIFYAGKEFITTLSSFLSASEQHEPLRHLDLSGLNVTFEESLINLVTENHTQIETLNIMNNVLVCKISPNCLFKLVRNCRKLKSLAVHHCSLNEETLLSFVEENREPLTKLSFKCRRVEKYGKPFEATTWQKVTKKLPDLRVTLIFDHTCPLHKIPEIMTPDVPVSVLRLETFTYIYDEVRLAARYYPKTLKKMVLNTPLSRNAPELNKALVELAKQCKLLSTLHVFCVLEENTVEEILQLHPEMKEKETYTLRFSDSPAPWIPGNDCGEDE